jgi:outer membrane protein OmpA-like peptidoglycan-associated protein
VGYLLTQPYDSATNQNLSNFDGDIKTTTAHVAWNSSPMAQLDMRVYYDYYDKQNNSTTVSYRQGSQGSNCPGSTTSGTNATCFTIAALTEENGEAFWYKKNAAGVDLVYAFNRTNRLLGGFGWEEVKRNLAEAPKNDDYLYWIEYRNTGWDNLTGRLKYEFLQRKADLVNTAAADSVNAYYTAYDVNNFNRNMVKLNVDWTPTPMLLIGVGATWRQTDFKDNLYGQTQNKSEQYDATLSWGDEKFRLTAIGNWGKIQIDQAYLNGAFPPPAPNTSTNFEWGSRNTQDGWMGAALVDWAATDKLMLTASYSYQKTGGGVDFNSGNTAAGGGYLGGPLVNYNTDNTKLQRFQIKGNYNYSPKWAFNAGYAYEKYDYSDGQMSSYGGYYPYFMNLNTAAVGSGYSYLSGAFGNPSYKNNLVWLTVTYKFDPPPQVYVAQKLAEAPAPAPVAKPAPPPPPATAPAPPPPPPPQVQKITLAAEVLFDFDKAVLKPEGKAAIDSLVIAKLAQIKTLEVVIVTGHTDRLGTDAYNQTLSEARAKAVGDYLASKGVDKAKIQTVGKGEKEPVVQCNQKNMKELIACLQPNRRVDVQLKGESTK